MSLHQQLAEWSAWGWPLIANHLWQATLVSLLAAVASRMLKRSPARARYIVWLIASLKFVVPSVLIVFLATQAGIKFPFLFDSTTAPQGVTMIYQVAMPVAESSEPSIISADSPRGHNEIYCALTAIWITGSAALLGLWLRRRRQFSVSIRAGKAMSAGREVEALGRVRAWLAIKRPVGLVITPKLIEPGVWRTWRPVIVLPADMSEHLTAAELEAVMMHEMIHVARWDNLANSFQMLFCCMLWFHPIVWLIDRKLLAEREQSCDERVIELGGAAKVYASSLLKVFRFCLGSKVAGVSYATGSNLRRRIEQIMAENTDRRFALSHRILIAAIAATVIIFSLAAGLFGYASARAQSKKVNAVKPGGPGDGVPGQIIDGVPGGVPGGIPGGVIGGIPGGVIGGPQDPRGEPPPPPPRFSNAVLEEIEQAPEITAQFINRDNAPLVITGVKVKAMQHRTRSSDESASSYYIVKTIVSMVNNTDRRIKGIKVQFTNKDKNYVLITDRIRLRIEPQATYIFGKSAREFMLYVRQLGNPESLVAEIIGVQFEDGSEWGDASRNHLPPPPVNPDAAAVPPQPSDLGVPPPQPSDESAPDEAKVVRESGGVLQTSAIKRVEPVYSPLAKAAQVSGAVAVEIIIDEEGNVVSARAISGHPLLRAAAVEAARQWQFKPTTLSGVAVRVLGTLTFNFQL